MLDKVRALESDSGQDTSVNVEDVEPVKAVFYEFYSDTCPHCKKMKPIVEEFRRKHESRFEDFRLIPFDTASNISLFHEFRVTGTPTFVIADAEGKEVDRVAGEMKLEDLEKFMQSSFRRLRK
jgi:thioredoxin 1